MSAPVEPRVEGEATGAGTRSRPVWSDGTLRDVLLDELAAGASLARGCVLIAALPLLAGIACSAALELMGASGSVTVFVSGLVMLTAAFGGALAHLHLKLLDGVEIAHRRALLRRRAERYRPADGAVSDRGRVVGRLAAVGLAMPVDGGRHRLRFVACPIFLAASVLAALGIGTALIGGTYGGLVHPAGVASGWTRIWAAACDCGVLLALPAGLEVLLLRLAFSGETEPPARERS